MSDDADLATIVAACAHELRSPVASVRGVAQLLADRWPELADDDRSELLAQIDRDARRMARLVDELLDVARLDAGRLSVHRRPVDLAEVVHRVVATVTLTHPALAVDVTIASDLPPVRTDADRVAQVVTNLLENAAKYAADAHARVQVEPVDDRIELRVDDDGPGLPPGEHEAVFAPFARRAAEPSGLGLGLWISRRIAEALGGSLDAAPIDGGGTSFRLTLPAG